MGQTTVFQTKQIEEIRKRAENARRLDIKTVVEGWSKSLVDPGKLLEMFPSLKLKQRYELKAYQFRLGGNGHGLVFAVPQGITLPDPTDLIRTKEMPYPEGAVENVMTVLEGNDLPWSYFSASLLSRELDEFGAMWHGNNWTLHTVIDSMEAVQSLSTEPGKGDLLNFEEWEWVESKPLDWKPKVIETDKQIIVEFLTYSALGHKSIYKHTDTFERGKYNFTSVEKVIAIGPMGYVF